MGILDKLVKVGTVTVEQAEQIKKNVSEMSKEAGAGQEFAAAARGLPWAQMGTMAAVNTALGAIAVGGSKAVGAIRDHIGHAKGYKEMLDANPDLGETDSKRTQSAYRTLYKLNPTYAKDPFVSGQFVKNVTSMEQVPMSAFHDVSFAAKNIADTRRGGDPLVEAMTPALRMEQMPGSREQQMAETLSRRAGMREHEKTLRDAGMKDPFGAKYVGP